MFIVLNAVLWILTLLFFFFFCFSFGFSSFIYFYHIFFWVWDPKLTNPKLGDQTQLWPVLLPDLLYQLYLSALWSFSCEVNTCPICVREEVHKFLEIFANNYWFTNFKNPRMFCMVITQKFILNLKMTLLKR